MGFNNPHITKERENRLKDFKKTFTQWACGSIELSNI